MTIRQSLRHTLSAVLVAAAASAGAAENPMWRTALVWSCQYEMAIQCERSRDCAPVTVKGTIELDYDENRVVEETGTSHAIKRHYVQTIAGSPIASEVKVELINNQVLWLSPADDAGIFSNNWVGAILSPKAGVVIQDLRPLACKPVRRAARPN
ncbi:hypothetical protein [Ensifer aridi]|uniref:hypothetical protein n=1 Tax=Ensifer aridi TaxID=1708715 RepID=UPI0011116D38|nr:hypothetical protein [Ensifer aridi]